MEKVNSDQFVPIQHKYTTKNAQTLGNFLIFTGLVAGLFLCSFSFLVIPKLSALYIDEAVKYNYDPMLPYLLLGSAEVIILIQIIYGFILHSKKEPIQAKAMHLGQTILMISGGILLLIIPFLLVYVITPIYKLTTSF